MRPVADGQPNSLEDVFSKTGGAIPSTSPITSGNCHTGLARTRTSENGSPSIGVMCSADATATLKSQVALTTPSRSTPSQGVMILCSVRENSDPVGRGFQVRKSTCFCILPGPEVAG